MRVLITADLHYRPKWRDGLLDFAGWVAGQRPDCFIVAGDVGHPLRLFRRGLQLFRDLDCPRLFLTGNHDLYRGEHDSRSLWEREIERAAAEEGFAWLEQESFCCGSVGICGTMGWYDYSSALPELALRAADYGRLKALVSHDADYIDWPWGDRAMARLLANRFRRRLRELHDDPTVERILVVTHMPIFGDAIPHHPSSEFWTLMQAYMGNLTLGEWVRQQPKVSHAVSGHIHRAGSWMIPAAGGSIECQIVGSQHGAPQAILLEF